MVSLLRLLAGLRIPLQAAAQCNLEGNGLGVRPICQHNFGNNRMLKEPRIMLE